MCGGTVGKLTSSALNSVGLGPASTAGAPSDVGTIGQPDTAKTQIGDTGAAMVMQRRRPRSLLAGAAAGDTSGAAVATPGAKATLGG